MYTIIKTQFHGATNTKGSRITARAPDKGISRTHMITLPYNHALSPFLNHAMACKALVAKLEWEGIWRGGEDPDAGVTVWVRTKHDDAFDFQYPVSE